MDSQRFRQAAGLNGCYHDKNDARDVVDLTLRLGLGNHAGRSHRINLIDLYVNAGLNHHGRLNGDNLHGSWPKEMMWNHLYYMNIPQYATDSAVELAAYHSSYNSNPGNFPTPAMNGQTLLNTVARNVDHGEIERSSFVIAIQLHCNASGIKCRREEEKRRGREAALECLKRAMTASSRQE
ncbi:zinc finger family protein [Salix suchowensis]|nr:zinc finger family protein [Salix suchowensis]